MEEKPIKTPPVKLSDENLSTLRDIIEGTVDGYLRHEARHKLHWLGLITEKYDLPSEAAVNKMQRELKAKHAIAQKFLAAREYHKLDRIAGELSSLKDRMTQKAMQYFATAKGIQALKQSLEKAKP